MCITLLIVLPAWTRHRTFAAQAEPYGHYSENQIVQRTAAICLRVCPLSESLTFVPERRSSWNTAGDEVRRWVVEYHRSSGALVGTVFWNADTGAMEQLSQELPPTPDFTGRIPSNQAANVAIFWIDCLQAENARAWQAETELVNLQNIWKCQLRSSGSRATVNVRANDGQLLFVRLNVQ